MGNSLELGNHSANPEQTQALKVTMETGAHRGFQGVGWVGGRMDRWARDGEKGVGGSCFRSRRVRAWGSSREHLGAEVWGAGRVS